MVELLHSFCIALCMIKNIRENLIWEQHAYCVYMYWKLSDGKGEEILLRLVYLLSAYH